MAFNQNISCSVTAFSNARLACFQERTDNFTVIAKDKASGQRLNVFCPLFAAEKYLLRPGVGLFLTATVTLESRQRNAWSLAAVCRRGKPVLLNRPAIDQVTEDLILPALFPESRFQRCPKIGKTVCSDWLLTLPNSEPLALSTEYCPTARFGRAFFPEAPESADRRYLNRYKNKQGAILFIVGDSRARAVSPNPHSAFDFCEVLREKAAGSEIYAASIDCDQQGRVSLDRLCLPFDQSLTCGLSKDRGVYQIHLYLARAQKITVGRLGETRFLAGFYVYTGSAQKNMVSRLKRHLRKRRNKRFHWHIDYLRQAADWCRSYPILSNRTNLEAALARETARLGCPVKGFGSSDSPADSHLTYFAVDPLTNHRWIDLLLRYRFKESVIRY